MSLELNGTTGVSLVQDGVVTADDLTSGAVEGAFTTQIGGRRNLIINGAMQVAQRGTSFTATGYSLDHWYAAESGTCTVTQDTADTPSGFKYALKTATSAATSFVAFYQPFESIDLEHFKSVTVTLSFYAKVNATFSGDLTVDVQSGDTADTLLSGNWTANDPQTITPTTSWQRHSVQIDVSSSVGARLVITPAAAQDSGAEYSITGVQLEVGSVATPFEHRSYGEELALCQRYFEVICDGTYPLGNATSWTGGQSYASRSFITEKRSSPSMSFTGSVYIFTTGGAAVSRTPSAGSFSPLGYELLMTGGSVTGFVRGLNSSTKITADAEL